MSRQAGDPSKHHYIPEFYLRWWTGDDGRFERYTRVTPQKIMVRRVSPSEAGFERDLYRSPGEIGKNRNWLETRLFQQIDDQAARVLVKLNSANPFQLNDEEMSSWSIFIRSLYHRTPDRMREFRESGQIEWLHAIDGAQARYPELKGERDPETFEEYRALHTSEQVDRLVLRVLPGIFFSERVGTVLNNLYKRRFQIPRGMPRLLISDSMLAMTNGLQIEGGHYAIPLSPNHLLIAAHSQETIDQATALPIKELAGNMNRWTVDNARHFVGALDRSQDRFIRNRFRGQVGRAL